MSAPWGVEFNKEVIILGNLLIEVGVGQDEDTLIKLSSENSFDGSSSNQEKKTNLLHTI